MKDKIYTIPINEAFDAQGECPFCTLAKKLEDEAVEYALGAAMMEPDYRVLSNEKGYCNKHFSMLFKKPNKLSLALVLDTHYDELLKSLNAISEGAEANKSEKKSLFKKESDSIVKPLSDLEDRLGSCIVCEKLDSTMERYVRVFFAMWDDEEEFRAKVKNSKGFCLSHFAKLLKAAPLYLGKRKYNEFCEFLCQKQKEEFERVHTDVHNFTLKFDYRNHNTPWGTEIDGPVRGVEKISGYILKDEKNSK